MKLNTGQQVLPLVVTMCVSRVTSVGPMVSYAGTAARLRRLLSAS